MIGRKNKYGPLVEEYYRWNTPVIGAYVLYIFSKEYKERYKEKHGEIRSPDFILMAIATTILNNPDLCSAIKGKLSITTIKNNLRQRNKHTLINNIHDSVIETLPYTLAAIDIAIHCGILRLYADIMEYEAVKIKANRGTNNLISKSTREITGYARTLARLFSHYKESYLVAQALEVSL